MFLPLDERFTTRDAVLNLAGVTPYTLLTPNTSLLPSQKTPAPLDELIAWVDANMPLADAAIISSEVRGGGRLLVLGWLVRSAVQSVERERAAVECSLL